jgi:hypothetical protein
MYNYHPGIQVIPPTGQGGYQVVSGPGFTIYQPVKQKSQEHLWVPLALTGLTAAGLVTTALFGRGQVGKTVGIGLTITGGLGLASSLAYKLMNKE